MEKIIEITKLEHEIDRKCLVCCSDMATTKFRLQRPLHNDIITSFVVCDACLVKMQKDIETCE